MFSNWSATLKWKLLTLVEDQQNQENAIDWQKISKQLQISPLSCKAKYEELKDGKNYKTGFYTYEEDLALMKAWKKCKNDFQKYPEMLPFPRAIQSIQNRVRTIFKKHLKSSGSPNMAVIEMNISIEEMRKHVNKRKSRSEELIN
jgi:hypothetical protein